MNIFKNKLNVVILVFFIASLLYVIYTLIFNSSDKNMGGNGKNNYTKEEVEIYSSDEYLVLDYNTFYTIENISKQIILALSEGKYKELYGVLSSDLAGDISKEQYKNIFSEFYISNFSDIKDEEGIVVEAYQNSKNLVNAYSIAENTYIAEIKNNHNGTTKIGIKTSSDNTYEIVYFEM